MRTKFCGITTAADAAAAVALGVDALGFVFFAPSPRCVSVATARAIIAALPPFVTSVGLFVNESPETLRQTVNATGIDMVQFHGDESAAICRQSPRAWIKAVRVRQRTDIEAALETYQDAAAVLLDGYDPALFGGSGKVFDWSLLPANATKPIILAGGLTVDNVAAAVRATRPYAVDVSGGIERSIGVKEFAKMQKFLYAVEHVDEQP